MVSRPQINAAQFARFVGLAEASSTIDVSTDEDFGAVPRLIPTAVRPNREGRTVSAKRARSKIDHIACPWLIRRFDDPNAVYLFVQASEASAVASALQRRRSTSRTGSAIATNAARPTRCWRNSAKEPSRCVICPPS